jgi:hypothetical protein
VMTGEGRVRWDGAEWERRGGGGTGVGTGKDMKRVDRTGEERGGEDSRIADTTSAFNRQLAEQLDVMEGLEQRGMILQQDTCRVQRSKPLVQHCALQYSTALYIAVQYSTMQCEVNLLGERGIFCLPGDRKGDCSCSCE